MESIRKKYKTSKITTGIIFLVIAAIFLFIAVSDRFIGVDSSAMNLNEIDASEIHAGDAYITVGYVYDYFSYYGDENGKDISSKCYIIPVGDQEYMAIDLDGKNMRTMDKNLDTIEAFYEAGGTDYDALQNDLEWIDLKGKVTVLSGQNKIFWDDYLRESGVSAAEQGQYFLDYIFEPNEFGSGTSGGSTLFIFIGLVCLVVSLIFILVGLFSNPLAEIDDYIKKSNANKDLVMSKLDRLLLSSSGRFDVYANDEYFMYVGNKKSKVKFFETKDIIWAYKKVTQHKTNGIPTGKTYSMMFKAANGKNFEVPVAKREEASCMEYFMGLIPDSVFGYTNEINQLYNREREQMTAEVLRRRKLRLGEEPEVFEG